MDKIRTVVFAERMGTCAGGTEVYEKEIITALMEGNDTPGERVEIAPLLAHSKAPGLIPEQFRPRCRVLSPGGKAGTLLAAGPTARRMGADLFHACFVIPPLLGRMKVVATVHDLGFVVHPDHYPKALVWRLKRNLQRVVDRADIIVTGSEYTRKVLLELTRAKPGRVVTVHYGLDGSFTPGEGPADLVKYGVTKPYILYAGRLQPRKNVSAVVEAFENLRESGRFDGQLVLLGEPRAFLWEEPQRRIDSSPYRADIVQTGHVPFAKVPSFFRGARVFAFLSLYEGFGFPVVEAMACGVPVVSSNLTSLPEVAGNAAILVDPLDGEAVSDALDRAIHSRSLREEMIAGGVVQAAKFKWRRSASGLRRIYRELK